MGSGRLLRQSLSVLLTWSLLFSGVWPSTGRADGDAESSAVSEGATEFNELIRNSERLSPGQPRQSFPLDRFLLLEQEVHQRSYVGRAFSIASTANERELEVHAARIDLLRALIAHVRHYQREDFPTTEKACDGFLDQPEFSVASIKESILAYVNEGRAKDVPLLVWNRRESPTELQCLDQEFSTLLESWQAQYEELSADSNRLVTIPNFTEAPEKRLKRYYNWWDLSVTLQGADGETVDHFGLKTTADHHAIDDHNSVVCESGCKFLLKADGNTIHTFHTPVRHLTSFGPYLVFAFEDSYDAEAGVQHLFFLDLASYGSSLGNAEIPIFRLPVLSSKPVQSLTVKNQKLVLDGYEWIPVEDFMAASELQQIAFNLLANAVDTEQLADLIPYLESLHVVFEKIMNARIQEAIDEPAQARRAIVQLEQLGKQLDRQVRESPKLSQILSSADQAASSEDVAAMAKEQQGVLDALTKGLQSSREMQERTRKISEQRIASRTLMGRLEIFFRKLVSPQPNGSLKIRRALVMVGAYRQMNQGRFWSWVADRPWLQTTVLAVAVLAVTSPSTLVHVMEGGVAFGNGVFDYFKFTLLGLTEAVGKGTSATVAPVADLGSTLYKQYVADGNLARTLIALSVYVPFVLSCYYVPHLIFNLHRIYLDRQDPNWPGFVARQNQMIRDYYQRLADDEAKRRKMKLEQEESKRVEYSAEEVDQILKFVEQRKSESPAFRPPGPIGRLWAYSKSRFEKLRQAVWRSKTATVDGGDEDKVKGLWSALVSVVFSYPAMELTLSNWIRMFNWFSGARYSSISFLTLRDLGMKYEIPIFIRPKPITATVRILYPDFFNTTVVKRGPRLTLPTQVNGGLRGWGMRDLVWVREAFFGKPSEQRAIEEEFQRELSQSELKAAHEAFETKILDVEDAVFKVAFQAAMGRLPSFISDKDQLLELFKDRPLKTAYEKRVRDLPAKIRTFIRLYTEEIYSRTMHEYLSAQVQNEIGESLEETETKTILQMKDRLVRFRAASRQSEGPSFEPDQAVKIAQSFSQDEALAQAVAKNANRGEWSFRNWLVNRKYNVIADFDPRQNMSMEKYAVVQERLKSPNALSRAVRSEISKLLVTFPLDLAFKLLLSAGIPEGAFKPIQKEFWGTNSVAYFSRDAMYMGMASGFVMSMAADGWVKMLEDARQDNLGGYGIIPKGQDATSYFRWFRKQFNDKSNSLLGYWGYANNLVFWNLPASLSLTASFQYMFAGRMDLSLIFAGYVVGFATPLAAFYYKIDQAFERSVDFAAREIPDERWLAHPAVQELISKEKQYYRNRFQLLTDFYTSIQLNWLQNVEVIPTSLGTRGFVRSILYGPMLEELIVSKVFLPARSLTEGIPVIGQLVDATTGVCEHFFSNGNTDMWKKN